ncbi:MAG: hypothetical protein RIQ94_1147, partial [Pseudomonadota bacterium]
MIKKSVKSGVYQIVAPSGGFFDFDFDFSHPPPTELISGLWALAYASAQAQVSKNLNRITVERDGLRLMTDSQLSDVQMY